MVRKVASPARSSVPTLDPTAETPKKRSSGPPAAVATGLTGMGDGSADCGLLPFRFAVAIPASPTFPLAILRDYGMLTQSWQWEASRLSTPVGRARGSLPMTPSRLLLIALTLWGLVMIVPDLIRVAQPLGSFGFYANND